MRFESGVTFHGKLIGTEKVNSARGDGICRDMMVVLKARVKAAGAHKTKIRIFISLEGIKILDFFSGVSTQES